MCQLGTAAITLFIQTLSPLAALGIFFYFFLIHNQMNAHFLSLATSEPPVLIKSEGGGGSGGLHQRKLIS